MRPPLPISLHLPWPDRINWTAGAIMLRRCACKTHILVEIGWQCILAGTNVWMNPCMCTCTHGCIHACVCFLRVCNARHRSAARCSTMLYKAMQGTASRCRAIQFDAACNANPYDTMQWDVITQQSKACQYNTNNNVWFIGIHCRTIQQDTIWYNSIQRNMIRQSTTQYSSIT